MNRWWRLLKHRFWDETDALRLLKPDALARIQHAVATSETRHRGEIRVVVEAGLPLSYLMRSASPRERAVSLFGKLRVWDTEDNSGVLIYVLLAEHAIELVADRGLNQRVPASQWEAWVAAMRVAFREGRFEAGLLQTIAALDEVLVKHFPLDSGVHNPNELPDAPLML